MEIGLSASPPQDIDPPMSESHSNLPEPAGGDGTSPTPEGLDPSAPTHVVGIGASAGGLEAIELFFSNMPTPSGLAFVVVQHLSPDHRSMMVELLSKKTSMPVNRAEDGLEVKADHVYLIPPKMSLSIARGRLLLSEQEPVRGIHLPIDTFLRSLSEDQGERAVAIILSGTGSDGTRGVRAIKEMGGMVMVQDQHSARFDGMPRAAVSTGLADFVLPPQEMPRQLLAYARHPYVAGDPRPEPLVTDQSGLSRIFAALRTRTKVDFTYYKPSTIVRRIERRMSVNQIHDLRDYVAFLESYPGEVLALYRELLIGVTSFFRDPDAIGELGEKWLPELFRQAENREVRFWCAGCSTGEEAYSLAILAREAMERTGTGHDVKIFATDVDRDAILFAGEGRYPESIAADLGPELLSKYFYQRDDHFQIARNIREMVVFAEHNLLTAPPFTNIDLVSCRNLLIYLQPALQQKVIRMFNFSLNQNGILFLGTSETVGEMAEHFDTLHLRHKIFRSRGRDRHQFQASSGLPTRDGARWARPHRFPMPEVMRGELDEERLLARYLDALSNRYVPLSVVVNERMEVLHTLGDTEGFFTLPSGRVINDISKMATRELAIPLATGIQKAFRSREEITYSNIRLRDNDESEAIRIRVVPLPPKRGQDELVAVFIERVAREAETFPPPENGIRFDLNQEAQHRIQDLEQELQFTRENLQATIEELETSNEELQATNEELLASNEELQATNEELQATNEELHTVNAEYQKKLIELRELTNDVDNLLTHSGIGKLLLDENLDIRRFSPGVSRVFRILEADIGRSLGDLAHDFAGFHPHAEAKEVQATNRAVEREVEAADGSWHLVRIVPYAVGPGSFSGVLLTLVDITELKTSQSRLRDSLRSAEDIIRHIPAGVFLYRMDEEGRLLLEEGNPEAERLTGVSVGEQLGRTFDEIWPLAASAGLTEELARVAAGEKPYYHPAFRYSDGHVEGVYRISAFGLPGRRVAVSFEDVSGQEEVERRLREANDRMAVALEHAALGWWDWDVPSGRVTVSEHKASLLGLRLDEVEETLEFWTSRIHDEDREQAMEAMRAHLEGRAEEYRVAYRIRTRDGGYVTLVDRGRVLERDGEGRPIRVLGTVRAEQHVGDAHV